jgi:hypothetical protein
MEASELWDVLASDKRLPLLCPEFPTMSLVDHDVVCFMLNDRECIPWLIEVNLKKKVLGSVTLDEEDEKEAAAEEQVSWADIILRSGRTTLANPSSPTSSPCTWMSMLTWISIPSKSWFQQKLEDAKLKQAMEKGWIKQSSIET